MPKTKEEFYQELKKLGDKNDSKGIVDKLNDFGHKIYADADLEADNELNGICDYFKDIVSDPKKKDLDLVRDVFEKLGNQLSEGFIKTGKAFDEKYLKETFNGEIPGTEFVAGNQKDARELARGIAYYSPEALDTRIADEALKTVMTILLSPEQRKMLLGFVNAGVNKSFENHPELSQEKKVEYQDKFAGLPPSELSYQFRIYPDENKPVIKKFPEEIEKYLNATDSELDEYKRITERDKDKIEHSDRSLHYIDVAKQVRQKEMEYQKENLSPAKAYNANKDNIDFFLNDDANRSKGSKSDSYKNLISSLKTLKEMQEDPQIYKMKDVREAMENAAKAAEIYDKEHSGLRHPFSAMRGDGKARRDAAKNLSETLKDNLRDFNITFNNLSQQGIAFNNDSVASMTENEQDKRIVKNYYQEVSEISDMTDKKIEELRNTYEPRFAEGESFENQKEAMKDYTSKLIAVNMLSKSAKNSVENLSELSDKDMERISKSKKNVTREELAQKIGKEMLSDESIQEASEQIKERADFKQMMQHLSKERKYS